jgi:hypothetical protein
MTFRISTKCSLNGPLQWVIWRMASNRPQTRTSNYFTWSINVLIMFGYMLCGRQIPTEQYIPVYCPREDSQTILSTVLQHSQPPKRFPFSALAHSISNWQPTQWKSTIIQEVKSDTIRMHSLHSYMRLLVYEDERTAAYLLRRLV